MENELQSFIKVWSTALASLIYCYYIPSRLPRGLPRLLSITPVLALFTLLPFHLHTVSLSGSTAFFLTWLANFKLLLFSFGQGPLSHHSNSLPNFLSLASLPITTISPQNATVSLQNAVVPLPIRVALFLCTLLIVDYKTSLHPVLILLLYSFHVYIFTELELLLASIPIRKFLGLHLAPQFDEPYLATSLQDFWSHRWNLAIPSILRPSIYDPVRSIFYKVMAERSAKLVGVIAAFAVSGLMHEFIFYVMTRVGPSWEVTGFFALHGVCMVLEVVVKMKVGERGKKRVPRWVSTPLTLGFVALTAEWLFFPPMVRNGADERMIRELKVGLKFLSGFWAEAH